MHGTKAYTCNPPSAAWLQGDRSRLLRTSNTRAMNAMANARAAAAAVLATTTAVDPLPGEGYSFGSVNATGSSGADVFDGGWADSGDAGAACREWFFFFFFFF